MQLIHELSPIRNFLKILYLYTSFEQSRYLLDAVTKTTTITTNNLLSRSEAKLQERMLILSFFFGFLKEQVVIAV